MVAIGICARLERAFWMAVPVVGELNEIVLTGSFNANISKAGGGEITTYDLRPFCQKTNIAMNWGRSSHQTQSTILSETNDAHQSTLYWSWVSALQSFTCIQEYMYHVRHHLHVFKNTCITALPPYVITLPNQCLSGLSSKL